MALKNELVKNKAMRRFGDAEARFGAAVACFGDAEARFGAAVAPLWLSAVARFGAAVARFGSAVACFGDAEARFGSTVACFRKILRASASFGVALASLG